MSEAMLRAALAAGRPLGVKFEAAWCGDCVELNEALNTSPLEEITCITLDADAEDCAEVMARLAVLELPTLVLLDPDGQERGRVVGFHGWASWSRDFDAVRDGALTLETLRSRAATGRDEALACAEAQLSRDPADGVAQLEGLASGDDDVAAEALHRLGRFHQRAKQDPATARALWRELFLRFEGHPRAPGALVWYAQAQVALGHPEQGGDAFEAQHRMRPKDAEIVLSWAAFAAREGLEAQRAVVREAALEALSSARGTDRERLENLVMSLGLPFDQKPAS